jgi:phage antirepressor YoqD-like protein
MTDLAISDHLVESRVDRDRYGDRVDVLDKVKALGFLPDGLHLTTELVARYFNVHPDAIEACIRDNRCELEENGYRNLRGSELSALKAEALWVNKFTSQLGLFNRRAVVRVGLLLRDSPIARAVREAVQDGYETTRPDVAKISRRDLAVWLIEAEDRASIAEAKVAELEPKADLADTFLIADGSTRLIREVAKLIAMRERDLRRFLVDEKLIFPKHAACGDISYDFYAEHAHHFVAKETVVNHSWGTCSHYTLRVTSRGIDLIRKRLLATPKSA